MNVDWLLGTPTDQMELSGISNKTDYTFKIVNKGSDGKVHSTSHPKLHSPPVIVEVVDGVEERKHVMVPGTK